MTMQGTIPASGPDPIRLFISHVWHEDHAYLQVLELLAEARNLRFENLSKPQRESRAAMLDGGREELLDQVRPAELVIVLAAQYTEDPVMVLDIVEHARVRRIPVLLLPAQGQAGRLPQALARLATQVGSWSSRELADSIRRLARGENPSQYDVIEFTLD
ncbi:MAG: hypothetical protein RL026_2641 [Pseudomonadota bacterium]|jgi:hypothetical protein